MLNRYLIPAAVAASLLLRVQALPAAPIATGGDHSCTVKASGGVACWGSTSESAAHEPIDIAGVASATDVAVGAQHACALTATKEVYCWGYNGSGELGTGDTVHSSAARKVVGLPPADSITAGTSHTCAKTGTTAWCWGDNSFAQLGVNPATAGEFSVTPIQVTLGNGVGSIATGAFHTCAAKTGIPARLFCWGRNQAGQLGLGDTADRLAPTEVNLPNSPVFLAAGTDHTCTTVFNAGLFCWGANDLGQLATGNANDAFVPVQTLWDAPLKRLAAGERVTCAIDANDAAWCWGSGAQGQLGNGSVMSRDEPQIVPGLFAEIAVGDDHVCARTLGDETSCWGSNTFGQLGIGGDSSRAAAPQKIDGFVGALVSVGRRHVCATQGQTVQCWGDNVWGQLGNGSREPALQPAQVGFGSGTVTSLASGERHTCAIRNGLVWCWGFNDFGQLGRAGGASDLPVQADLPSTGYTEVAAGLLHTCAIHGASGRVWCWGYNLYGQLGQVGEGGPTPTEVPGTYGNAMSIVSGRYHTCLLDADSDVYCWGNNDLGQAGNGTFSSAATATLVAGLPSNALSVAASATNTCASTFSGGLFCWGQRGLLGTDDPGLINPSAVPVQAEIPAHLFELTAGENHMCARRNSSGQVWCWGQNGDGQLGIGSYNGRLVPTPLQHSMGVISTMSAGGNTTCAVATEGLHCWGDGEYGQLADFDPGYRLIPTALPLAGLFTDGFED